MKVFLLKIYICEMFFRTHQCIIEKNNITKTFISYLDSWIIQFTIPYRIDLINIRLLYPVGRYFFKLHI